MSEILGTLFKYIAALLGVAVVAGIVYSVFAENKTASAISDTGILQANVTSLYNSQSNFTSLTTARAASGELAPRTMIVGAGLQNPWGGAVTVAVNPGNAARWDMTHPAVPPKECSKMATTLNTTVALSINGNAQTLPLDAGAAIGACNGAANTLVLTFGK